MTKGRKSASFGMVTLHLFKVLEAISDVGIMLIMKAEENFWNKTRHKTYIAENLFYIPHIHFPSLVHTPV